MQSLKLLVALLATLALASCDGRANEGLIVNVQTDYVPVAEFDAIRVQLDDGSARSIPVTTRSRFTRPAFVTLYDDALPGHRAVVLTLMAGSLVRAKRTVEIDFEGSYLVTVVLTRSCAGLECNPMESCLGRRCVPNTCITGSEPSCPMPMCTSDAMCSSSTPCVSAECVVGVCLQTPVDARCGADQVCLPETGCIPRPRDADAGSTDAGAAAPDAVVTRCSVPGDCNDMIACTTDTCDAGICAHTPTDSLCPDSACAPSDPMANAMSGCLPPCNATTCAPSGCDMAVCVAGRCQRTSTCAGGERCCTGVCALDCGSVTCAGQPAGTVCRAPAGPCDAAETCDGTSAECPPDGVLGSGSVCRAARGPCDVEERCTIGTIDCPGDGFTSTGTGCPEGSCDGLGTCTSGCTPGAPCSTGNPCELGQFACGPTRCVSAGPADPSTICRNAVGPCDVEERCGGSTSCPGDSFARGNECRSQRGVCDVADHCDGSSPNCPGDGHVSAGTECRGSAGPCDVEERCDGFSDDCPGNGFRSGNECRAQNGDCDVADHCDGSSAFCPGDNFRSGGTFCRGAVGACDAAEFCTGSSAYCPGDGFLAGPVCRPSAGICDLEETCNGGSRDCPADSYASGNTCRDPIGPCGRGEVCSGGSPECPPDTHQPSGNLCRSDRGACDEPEFCSGTSNDCPEDSHVPDGSSCNEACGTETCSSGNCVGGVTCTSPNPFCNCDSVCFHIDTPFCV